MGDGNEYKKLWAPELDGCARSKPGGQWYQVCAWVGWLEELGLIGGLPLDLRCGIVNGAGGQGGGGSRIFPCVFVLGMAAELAIFKHLDIVEVQESHSPVVKECGGVLVTCNCRRSKDIGSWELGMGARSYGRRSCMDVPGASLAGNGLRYLETIGGGCPQS